MLGCFSQNYAQQANNDENKVTEQDYQRMLEAQLQVDFRSYVIQKLNLDKDEIIAFDPIFRDYMNEKDSIVRREFKILDEYSQEVNKDASQSNKSEAWADAVEDYWAAQIDEMQLQKRYFDQLEDKIPPRKAFSFFILENAVKTRLRDVKIMKVMPMIIEIERMPSSDFGSNITGDSTGYNYNNRDSSGMYNNMNNNQMDYNNGMTNNRNDVDAFTSWYTENGKTHGTANTGLNNQSISEGLNKLVAAVASIAQSTNVDISDMSARKDRIMALTNDLSKNPMSNQRSDKAREAFIMTANLLHDVRIKMDANSPEKPKETTEQNAIQQTQNAAQGIKVDQALSKQMTAVNNFFNHAETAVTTMSNEVKWTDKR